MKTKYIISALLVAGLATAAHAQQIGNTGDLILGFSQTGNSSNYEVDLGNISSLIAAADSSSPVNLSADLSSADLTSIFGANWASAGNVTIGAAATTGAATKATWVTQFDSVQTALNPGGVVPASKYKDTTGTNLNSRYIDIGNVETGLNSTNGTISSNVSTAATVATANAASWTHWETNGSNGFGGTGSQADAGTSLSLAAGQYEVIDLFNYVSGTTSTPGTYNISLELSSTGGLFATDFVPTAIPEPSVYAVILGAATLAFVAIRRRKQQMFA